MMAQQRQQVAVTVARAAAESFHIESQSEDRESELETAWIFKFPEPIPVTCFIYQSKQWYQLGPGRHLIQTTTISFRKRIWKWDWGDGSVVQSICRSCRGPRFGSQYLYGGGSQLCVTPVLRDLTSSYGFQGHQAHTWHTHVHTGKILIHIRLK